MKRTSVPSGNTVQFALKHELFMLSLHHFCDKDSIERDLVEEVPGGHIGPLQCLVHGPSANSESDTFSSTFRE